MGQKATKATDNAKELMFLKSKESMQEVSGWKVLIFLPKNTTWKTLVIFTIFCSIITGMTEFFYETHHGLLEALENICNMLYLLDVAFATLHYTMPRTRRLRFGRKRELVFLVLDFISILPMEDIWLKCRFCEGDCRSTGAGYLSLLQLLRFYQIPVYFATLRSSSYTVKKYLFLTILEIILYYFMLTHVLSCGIFLYFDEDRKKTCRKNFSFCATENFIVTFFLLSQEFTAPFSGYPLINYKLLIIIDFSLGYFFIWGFVAPLLTFANLKNFITQFQISRSIRHGKILTSFGKDDRKLEKKITDYLRHLNAFGLGKEQRNLLRIFPTAMKKSICCDLHWEAMRHSSILQDLSMGCKRSLAILMTSKFVLPDTVLFERNKGPTSFLFLESGMLNVLAEESSSYSVLNLSGGTVLGEISFFYHKISPATITVAKYSVIHVLKIRDFFAVLKYYPKDKRKILEKLKMRMELAKNLFFIKSQSTDLTMFEFSCAVEELKKGNIKWLKKQFREVSHLRNAENLMIINQNNQLYVDDYQRQIRNLETSVSHTSFYINLLGISEETENVGRVCLKDSFFCALDPDCYFLSFWKRCINCTIAFIMLLYPGVIGWVPIIPMWFYVISAIVSLILELDVAIQFVTVIKTNDHEIKKFSSIFMYRILRLPFFIDLAAAIPLQLFFYNNKQRFYSNCYFAIALIKVCKVIPAFRWITNEEKNVSYRILINYLVLLFVLIYWASAVFKITGVECIFYRCGPRDWYANLMSKMNVDPVFPPVLRAIKLALEITTQNEDTDVLKSFIVTLCIFLAFHFYNLQMKAGCSAAFIMDLSTYVEFRNTMGFLYNFMTEHNLKGNIRTRAISMMQFQWDVEGGITDAQKQEMYDNLQENLKMELNLKLKLPILLKSKLFHGEQQNFLLDICRGASRLFLPANSVLLTFGTQTRCLYIVEKGFVQINSFMVADLHLNTSRRITAGAGDAFPVIDVLTQTPSAISAVTVTECKILLLDLENVLSLMMIHGVFKDVVLTVKDTDLAALKSVKLAVSEFKDEFDEEDTYRKKVFKRISCLGTVLRFLLKKRAINSRGGRYLVWELIRLVTQMISFILWPVAMSFFAKSRSQRIFLASLLPLEIFPLVDFYVRMNVAYYNSKGIYITHTLCTFRHYLTTSFILDLIAFAPNFHITYIIVQEIYTITWSCYFVHMLMRFTCLYRYVGFMFYIRSQNSGILQFYVVMIGFLVFVLIHHFICITVLLVEENFLQSKVILTSENVKWTKPHQYYLEEWGVFLTLVLRSFFRLDEYDLYAAVTVTLGSAIGLLGEIILFSYLGVKFTVSEKNLMSYRYFLNSFVTFLVKQKVESNIIKEVVDYYEFRWRKLNGIFVKKLVSGFPESLQEDVLLLVYKETLSGICCFLNANDYFYRTLSRKVEELVLMKNSTVIFQQEVQVNIYFLHKGRCMVENSSTTLVKGALIGDIKSTGVMTNTVTAKSDVILLKISSKEFFQILNDFYVLRRKYETVVENAEDFITSVFRIEGEALSKIPSKVVEKEYLECEFVEPMTDGQSENQEVKKKGRKWLFKSDSKVLEVFGFIFLLVAYVTVLLIPFFLMTRLVTLSTLATIYTLDFLWLIKIVVSFMTVNPEDVVVNRTRKMSKWLVLRIIYNLLAVLPIELIPFVYFKGINVSQQNCYIFSFFYVNRFLRIFYVFHYFQMKRNQVMVNANFNVVEVFSLEVAFVNILSAVRLQLHHGMFSSEKCYTTLTSAQKDELLKNYLCMVNTFMSASLEECIPSSVLEVIFQLSVTFWAVLLKVYLINCVLLTIYLKRYNKGIQKAELQRILKYLKVRNVSPIIHIRCLTYYSNLLNIFHEVGEPHFLKTAPPYLKNRIMQDLCLTNLLQCELFQRVDEVFLKQLAVRVSIQVYFPGDYITEKGDVDHNMYFIKKGEVYCVENDRTYTAMETAIYLLSAGDTFGLPQGVLPAYPHSHTFRSKTSSSILVLNHFAWEDLRLAFPDTANFIHSRCLDSLKSPEILKRDKKNSVEFPKKQQH